MDIDARLQALTESLKLLAHMHADAEKRQEERHIEAEKRQEEAEQRHNREMEVIRREGRAFRGDLRRAVAMGVREARNERSRRQEWDGKIAQLTAAQLVTEEKLQHLSGTVDAFIDSMRSGVNGRQRSQ
ncbi:MAG TPA: hypothetical protein VN924_26400 [Bryobacteraceae bacterium]|nr:hypothetical protein [Bryobacteraceae bacterium]